jgi:hypothetical protein
MSCVRDSSKYCHKFPYFNYFKMKVCDACDQPRPVIEKEVES